MVDRLEKGADVLAGAMKRDMQTPVPEAFLCNCVAVSHACMDVTVLFLPPPALCLSLALGGGIH